MSNNNSPFPPPPDSAEPEAMENYIKNMSDDHRAAILFAVLAGGLTSIADNTAANDGTELSETEAIIFTLATVANWPYERARKALMGAMISITAASAFRRDPSANSGNN